MNFDKLDQIPLGCLTVQQFEDILDKHLANIKSPEENLREERKLIKGMAELADFLGMSLSTVQRLKSSGILIPATMQIGRKCIFDAQKVLELMQSRSAVIHYKKKRNK